MLKTGLQDTQLISLLQVAVSILG